MDVKRWEQKGYMCCSATHQSVTNMSFNKQDGFITGRTKSLTTYLQMQVVIPDSSVIYGEGRRVNFNSE